MSYNTYDTRNNQRKVRDLIKNPAAGDRLSDGTYKVGHVYNDSGTLALVDPCYVDGDDFKEADYSETFGHNDDALREYEMMKIGGVATPLVTDGRKRDEVYDADSKRQDGEFQGLVVSTGYGDGTYPVYVKVEGGRVKSVTVKFF